MSNQFLGSKVVVTEKTPVVRTVQSVNTAVLAVVGISQRGPVGVPQQYISFSQFVDACGTATPENVETWLGIQGFFAEGGQFLWFTRTAHYTDITNAATLVAVQAEFTVQTASPTAATIPGVNQFPVALSAGDNFSISIDGGGASVATFDATAAVETAVGPAPYGLVHGDVISIELDQSGIFQEFTIIDGDYADLVGAGATAAELVTLLNGSAASGQDALAGGTASAPGVDLVITSDMAGTMSRVAVSGTANAVAELAFPAPTDGTGDVADIGAVTLAEFTTVVEADVAGTDVTDDGLGGANISTTDTGVGATIQITASTGVVAATGHSTDLFTGTAGTAIDTLTIEARDPGDYGNDLTIRIGDATSGEADRFNLTVLQNGLVIPGEVFPNLSMDDTDANYIETILAAQGVGSKYVRAIDEDAGLLDRPANGDYPLAGGDDGLTGLTDLDFIGSEASLTGLRSFDSVTGLTLLAVPGRATVAVQNAMVNYAENQYPQGPGFMLAILEPPEAMNAQQIITYWETTAAILGSSQYAACYWPRIVVSNPNQTLFGASETVVSTISGHIAGVKARTDNSGPGGKYEPAAGIPFGRLTTSLGFEPDPDGLAEHQVTNPTVRDLIYPKRINPIAPVDGLRAIDGTKTTSAIGQFPTVPERRTAIFIERSIRNASHQFRHRNNNRTTRMSMERTFEQFLINQMKLGAFASEVPAEAFQIDVSEARNDLGAVLSGLARVSIGIATNKPLDFIWIEFSQHFVPAGA